MLSASGHSFLVRCMVFCYHKITSEFNPGLFDIYLLKLEKRCTCRQDFILNAKLNYNVARYFVAKIYFLIISFHENCQKIRSDYCSFKLNFVLLEFIGIYSPIYCALSVTVWKGMTAVIWKLTFYIFVLIELSRAILLKL